MAEDWRSDLEVWLAPFLAALRHKTRMRVCPAYIAGLIGPGDRKSVQWPGRNCDCLTCQPMPGRVSGLEKAAHLGV